MRTNRRRIRAARLLHLVLLASLGFVAASIRTPGRYSDDEGASPKPYAMFRGDSRPPRAPNGFFFNERAFPLGGIPRDQWRDALTQALLERAMEAGGPPWTPRGPTNIGGRVTDIAVHPLDDDIVYAGAAEGGVLRTVDGGQSWTPLFDDQPALSIGAVAIDPVHPDVIYAGTGEVNPGGGSVAYGGTGLYRSMDGGTTWACIGLEESGSIGRIRIDPTDPDRIFVAVTGLLWDPGPDRGVYRTTNGGMTWERVLFVADDTGCVDLIMRPDNPDVLYAAMWQRLRQPDAYDYGGANCAVHRSFDGGETWTIAGGGLPVPNDESGRIGLSLCAGQPDVVHAIYADRTGFFDGLYRSTNGGFTWTRTNDGVLSTVFASFGWWFGNVRTHPVDPNAVYVLGLEFYRSADGGASFFNASGGMHVDHHALDFGPGPEPVLFAGNDGGVYRSSDQGEGWEKLFNLPITQAYRIAVDANDPNAIYLGAQDNGTNRTQTGSIDDWNRITDGDGFQPLVHPADSARVWTESQYGLVWHTPDGGRSWSVAVGGIDSSDRRNWNSPHVQDPTDPEIRYFGTNRVYRSASATEWFAISPDLTDGTDGASGQVSGTLTTIRVSPVDGEVIWTGSDDGLVHVTQDGGQAWTDVSGTLPVRWITSVRADPFDRETAYVTISGFRWGEPLPRVYRTTDLGATWDATAGGLPDAPVNDLLADPAIPGRYFAATDVGVYETRDEGVTWTRFGLGLPNVVVTSFALDDVSRELYAGTYGRSLFSADIGATCLGDLDGDQAVGFLDLLTLLSAWGSTTGPADLDGDGDVGFTDLLIVLSAWGPCLR